MPGIAQRHDCFCFVGIHLNSIGQARKLKDMLVVVAQPIGKQALFLAIDADQKRNNQADAATVHILQVAEIEQNSTRGSCAGSCIGVYEQLFRRCSKFALNVDNAGYIIDCASLHGNLRLCHGFPVSCPATQFSRDLQRKMTRFNGS
jgi:hypothetical protein